MSILALFKLLLTVITFRISSLRHKRTLVTCNSHPYQNLIAQPPVENLSEPPRVLLGQPHALKARTRLPESEFQLITHVLLLGFPLRQILRPFGFGDLAQYAFTRHDAACERFSISALVVVGLEVRREVPAAEVAESINGVCGYMFQGCAGDDSRACFRVVGLWCPAERCAGRILGARL